MDGMQLQFPDASSPRTYVSLHWQLTRQNAVEALERPGTPALGFRGRSLGGRFQSPTGPIAMLASKSPTASGVGGSTAVRAVIQSRGAIPSKASSTTSSQH